MNVFAKFILVLTSLTPLMGAMVVIGFERGDRWIYWMPWLGAGILLVVACWRMLRYMAFKGQIQELHIQEFERRDTEMLAYLVIYLLPFVQSAHPTFATNRPTNFYILAIIILAIWHAGAFHFKPCNGLAFSISLLFCSKL